MNKFLISSFTAMCVISMQMLFSTSIYEEKKIEDMKILVLIIASDDMPVYRKLAEVWRSYMNLDSTHFECYFIRGNPELLSNSYITGDTIWCKTEENIMPGIINKTVLAIQAMSPRLEEFDYLLRTNLSSFYVFPRLLEVVHNLPRENCYAGVRGVKSIPFASGAGFLLSKDLVKKISMEGNKMYNDRSDYDDVIVGKFFYNKIDIINLPREDILNWEQWLDKKENLSSGFHFRIKNDDPLLRYSSDVYIHNSLRRFFY